MSLEHFAGKFPLWLSPVQVKILPISDRYIDYAEEIQRGLEKEEIRCEMDKRAEKIGYKIRAAQMERVPYMLVVGEREAKSKEISVRKREEGDLGSMSFHQLLEILQKEGI